MAIKRQIVTTQLTAALKADFENAISADFNGVSDFFRRCINEKCDVQRIATEEKEVKKGTLPLCASVSPEQRAALLAQCEKEGVTMGTWMRNQIKEYLASKETK